MVVFPFTETSFDSNPVELNTRVPLSGTLLMVNAPAALVVTPLLVPLITMLTPSSGAFFESVTLPVMVVGGANKGEVELGSFHPACAVTAKEPRRIAKHTILSMHDPAAVL